jgi:hypothetical protein
VQAGDPERARLANVPRLPAASSDDETGPTTDKLLAKLFGASTFFFLLFVIFGVVVVIPMAISMAWISFNLWRKGGSWR